MTSLSEINVVPLVDVMLVMLVMVVLLVMVWACSAVELAFRAGVTHGPSSRHCGPDQIVKITNDVFRRDAIGRCAEQPCSLEAKTAHAPLHTS